MKKKGAKLSLKIGAPSPESRTSLSTVVCICSTPRALKSNTNNTLTFSSVSKMLMIHTMTRPEGEAQRV